MKELETAPRTVWRVKPAQIELLYEFFSSRSLVQDVAYGTITQKMEGGGEKTIARVIRPHSKVILFIISKGWVLLVFCKLILLVCQINQ